MKRRGLVAFTIVLGCLGLLAAMLPFVFSLNPSADKESDLANVEVLISEISPGSYKLLVYRNRPVAVFRPTPENITDLNRATKYALNGKSILKPPPKVFVYYLLSTYKGCGLSHASINDMRESFYGNKWPGGYYDPCHFGEWDYAGRTLDFGGNLMRPLKDLEVPPFSISSAGIVRVGA